MTTRTDSRLVEIPHEQRQVLADLLTQHGAAETARKIGLSRSAILAAAATGRVMPGTASLIRESLGRQGSGGAR